ncbi:MAG TPA: NAD(P)/FAD-dependent oxidoreductase [Candidatus Deferrimicrobium sp.]|nr:NAD(P)/FAD-dependent oxidoreductase [Candidatus Deferrimicrobium sp.]
MTTQKEKIAVIGAGIMGLTLAYRLLNRGYDVTLFEKDDRPGGMSASFDFDGLQIERFYHFFCKPDTPVFELLKELDLDHRLTWKETKMGFFYEGKLYPWGNPFALMKFPGLGFISKLRFGLQVFLSIRRNKWDKLDGLTAAEWLKRFEGEKAYCVLWDSLLRLKFHGFKDAISAAWIWRRLRRVGVSRKNMLRETLAYLEGGVSKILETLEKKINAWGGKILLNADVTYIDIDERKNRVTGVRVNGQVHGFDKVISTIPLPYIPQIAPGLPKELIEKYKRLDNVGVVCVILKLTRSLTGNFWLNISDSNIDLPGIIEFSNLYPLEQKIVYFPFYLHRTHPWFSESDEFFTTKVVAYCKRINKDFSGDWVLGQKVHRYEYAQPVCPPVFLDMLPPVKTSVTGLYIVDTSYYYPEDRSLSESIRAAQELARDIVFDDQEPFRERVPGPPKAFD